MNKKLEVLSLSGVPVLWAHTDVYADDKDLDFLSNLEEEKLKGNNFLSVRKDIIRDKKLEKFKILFEKYLKFYSEEILCVENKFKFTDSWATRNPKNSTHHTHFHYNSMISGVYYVSSTCGGEFILNLVPIFFKNFQFKLNIKKYNEFNSLSWTIPAKTGDIIIFPSWMDHMVNENLSDVDRRIIGFNCFIEGNLGSSSDTDGLDISVNIS